MCSLTLFLQSSVDQSINFDERTIQYIIENRCNHDGNVNYNSLAKDMIIKTYIDFTGSIILQWHIKQALTLNQKDDKQTMLIHIEKSQSDSASKVSRTVKSQSNCSEVGEAFRKVIIKKGH